MMEVTSVHYEPGAIHINKHPDAEVQEVVQEHLDNESLMRRKYQEFIDGAPNLNEKYATEIAQVKEILAADGFEPAPIAILSHEDYHKALGIVGSEDPDFNSKLEGTFNFGRIIAQEYSQQMQEIFGNDIMLGLLLHEAAHSTMESKNIVISKTYSADYIARNGLSYRTHVEPLVGVGDFGKYKVLEDGQVAQLGSFMIEGFADLYRVRGLEKLGREWRLGSDGLLFHNTAVVGEDLDVSSKEIDPNLTIIPAKFASAAKVGEQRAALVTVPNYAAYGLHLLDQQTPGLFEQMIAARHDSSQFREVIKMINGIQPGLHRELRGLEYSLEDFKSGLSTIQKTLAK